jgi:hypothetical protein
VEEDALGGYYLSKSSEEVLLDRLLTLPLADKTDVHFQIMEIYLLWQAFFRKHVLYQQICAGLMRLFRKQSVMKGPIDELANEFRHTDLLPHGPRRRVIHRKPRHNSHTIDPFDPSLRAIAQQLQLLQRYTKVITGLRHGSPSVGDTTLDSDLGAQLATEGERHLRNSLALMCSTPTLVRGTGGVLLDEEQCQGINIHALGIRTGVTTVLQNLVELKVAVRACISAVAGIEAAQPNFRLAPDEDEHILRKVSQRIKDADEYEDAMEADAILLAYRMELAGFNECLSEDITEKEVSAPMLELSSAKSSVPTQTTLELEDQGLSGVYKRMLLDRAGL